MGQSFQQQIQQLAHSGLATHVVINPLSVDSVFAVSKVQDLPEVAFAAAFGDGTLALGCPDGLPEWLDGMAREIVLDEQVETPQPDASPNADAKIDALIETCRRQISKSLEHANTTDRVLEKVAELETKVQAPDLATKLDAIGAQLDQLLTRPEPDAPSENLRAPLDAIQGDIGQLLTRQNEAPQTAEALADIRKDLDALGAKLDTRSDGSEISDLKTAFAGIARQLDDIKAGPDDAGATADALSALQGDISAKLTDILAQMARLGNMPAPVLDLTPQRQSFAQFATVMSAAVQRLENAATHLQDAAQHGPDAPQHPAPEEGLLSAIEDLRGAVRQLTDTQAEDVAALRRAVQDLSDQPAPELDLTAQRENLARYGSALGAVLDRFSAIADKLEEGPQRSSPPEDMQNDASDDIDVGAQTDIPQDAQSDTIDTPPSLPEETPEPETMEGGVSAVAPDIEDAAEEASALDAPLSEAMETTPMSATDETPGDTPTMDTPRASPEDALAAAREAAGMFPSGDKISFDDLRLGLAELIASQIRDGDQVPARSDGGPLPKDV